MILHPVSGKERRGKKPSLGDEKESRGETMRQDLMNGRGPKTIRVPKAYRKVMDLTHNECDPALAESETKASDMTVSPRKAAPGSLPREAKEEGGREDRI
ncbi:hypothetical protein G6F17_013740 [Rhizopus arrhizus]|nr:hypothetical protein G6F17_013740 [Rhizopus arrhizus]KAG1364922.1 hypothetical protein G6F61_013568 [Rhizopus arrhizus]KAG1387400.1 hypothetical protein G6F60_014130 [Rhizopus arrhizus]